MSDEQYVNRGSSWGGKAASYVRGAYRDGVAPTSRFNSLGFRCIGQPQYYSVRGADCLFICAPNLGAGRRCYEDGSADHVSGFRCAVDAPDPYANKTREELIEMLRAR